MALHTILGANGTIATELIPILQQHGEELRLVSRSPKPVAGAQTIAADLLDKEATAQAVAGSEIVYLLVGLTYNSNVWARDWPVLMQNVIDACKRANAKLIFFDNVYPYGKPVGAITEATPFKPISKKGAVRARIDEMLLKEMKSGGLTAIIARAADFYGPRSTEKSAPGILVFKRMKEGKTPQWFVNPNVPRSLTYTPDAARAVYLLSQRASAFNQTWILPGVHPPLTGRQFITVAAMFMGGKKKIQVLPKWLIGAIGWFSPMMKEIHEMLYQDEFGYVLDSSRFEAAFHFVPTSYEDGIKATADWYLSN